MSVYFYGCVTLDGYLADSSHGLDWLYQTGSTEETGYEEFYRKMDVTIMGRRTYQEVEKQEGTAYPTTRNYVFTHAAALSSPGYTPVQGDVADFVRKLGADQNIWVVGGNTILAPLLDQDLVDQMVIQIAPVLLGRGVPLFTQREALKRFCLQEVKQYGSFAELVYGRD